VWLPDSETNWLKPLLAPGVNGEKRSFMRLSRHFR
jgi:hypothetical protein